MFCTVERKKEPIINENNSFYNSKEKSNNFKETG